MAAEHVIRSVLNLRGPNQGKPWYDEEVSACVRLGIIHYDGAWSALHDISPDRCQSVEDLIERAPKPLLIHCQARADRSGHAAAIYLLDQGASPETAKSQLCLWYLHFPYLGSRSIAMDRSFELYCLARSSAPLGRRDEVLRDTPSVCLLDGFLSVL